MVSVVKPELGITLSSAGAELAQHTLPRFGKLGVDLAWGQAESAASEAKANAEFNAEEATAGTAAGAGSGGAGVADALMVAPVVYGMAYATMEYYKGARSNFSQDYFSFLSLQLLKKYLLLFTPPPPPP